MPTKLFFRKWCIKCQEWTLHHYCFYNPDNNRKPFYKCSDCENVIDETRKRTDLSIIPEEKIQEQRERYKRSKRNDFTKVFDTFLRPSNAFMSSFGSAPVEIKEDDAGQREIDEEKEKKEYLAYVERKRQREADMIQYQKFKNLGRNDTCACGTGKKYKKCCMNKYQSYVQ